MISTGFLSLGEVILLLRLVIDLDLHCVLFLEKNSRQSRKKEILNDLGLETAELLVSLQLEDQDFLYGFVPSSLEMDLRFTGLFEFVYFDCLGISCRDN